MRRLGVKVYIGMKLQMAPGQIQTRDAGAQSEESQQVQLKQGHIREERRRRK